ncbi:MAG: class I SAM-dependent methyltransferase, partial [Bacteroidota bacterium]
MGLNINTTKLLLRNRQQGISFERTLTIGRQGLYMRRTAMAKNLKHFGMSQVDVDALFEESGGFAESFFKLLGAKQVDSMDASPYEKASMLHDMNLPIKAALQQQFDVVLDGGSLEHVFNFPGALKNCMEMVKEGGHFISISPSNNY